MTTLEPTPVYPSYAHPLLSWGSVILGALAAVAIGVLLNLLVAVFDGAATLHEIAKDGEAGDNVLLVGVFGGIANLIALYTGGFVAARSANHPDHHDGMLHGLGVWALSFVAAFMILGAGAGKTVGAALGEETGGASAAIAAGQTAAANQAAANPPVAGDVTGATPGVVAPTTPAGDVTPAQQKAAEADAQADAQAEAHDIAKGATETAFWAFAAMLVGLVAAVVGGVAGSRHPEHFVARPRRIVVVS